jgi:hypothetical protein
MMARSTNAPFKGRIQKRKTNHLQIFTFGLQRTAGPYKRATNGLMHGSNQRTAHFVRNAVAYRAARNSRWSWLCSEKAFVSSLWLLISARGQPSVRPNGPLEVFIFLAGNEAEVFQRRQLLLCPGRLPKHQISLTEMLMRAAVAGV